ncbi:PREDICTED: exocyst complex component 7-like isoform X4 [Branchiostoma belcheri]|uniref:Exocyst complex component 7 n=1 Tax=Branchiostoma belcheri TaxID=7741 RepID=A0A6P4YIE2_BRABE|nr:PREDICTED: exocyst complex component 7-like isoform X4 [Branchiostoma belcheri]KAI8500978.1 Exocyst complex component 7 [Branchiostoma belcheri]
MEDLSAKKREIDEKLQMETQKLAFLKDSLNKSNQLTENMVSILESFSSRLHKLEDTIVPVHRDTKNLQKLQDNIDKTLSSLDHVISFYNVAKDVEQTIREGPYGTPDPLAPKYPSQESDSQPPDGPTGRLESYLQSMDRVQNAVNFFSENNPGSPELHTVTQLFESGKDQLEREFRNLLTRHSRPVPAVTILDMLGTEDDSDDIPLEHLPERTVAELTEISSWLISQNSTDFMNVYAQIRSNTLIRSLDGLKQHQAKTGAAAGVSPASGGSRKLALKDTPTKKTAYLKGRTIIRKAGSSIMKHSSLTLDTARRQGSTAVAELKDDVSDTETDTCILCISALLKLMQSESKLMEGVIPRGDHNKIFEQLVQQSMDGVVADVENIATSAKRCIGKHDYSAVLSIFPVLKHLRAINPDYEKALEGTEQGHKLPSLMSTLDTTGAKALEEFIDSIKNDPDKQSNMPKDGTVHELTSNAMIFLQNLLEYLHTAGGMLAAQDPAGRDMQAAEVNERKLSIYIGKVLGALQLNLENKAKGYDDPALTAIFLLNNYHYILKTIKSSGLLQVVVLQTSDIVEHYEDIIREQKRLYSKSWSGVLRHILEISGKTVSQQRAAPQMGKLKDKERQTIKDRFKGFNQEFDDIYRTQKGYAIPDHELRQSLRNDNKEFILPAYTAFREKYEPMQFTKNPEKYIKYSAEEVSATIDRFFDLSA